jgi:hypothetical protein
MKFSIFVFLVFSLSSLVAANSRFQLQVPKVAYMQWVDGPHAQMTQTGTSSKRIVLRGGQGAERTYYVALMCNSLSGYAVYIRGAQSYSAEQGGAIGGDGSMVPYTVTLEPVYSSIQSGTDLRVMPDLSGASPSVQVSYSRGQALPLQASQPNVFALRVKLQGGDPNILYQTRLDLQVRLP